MPLVRPHLRGPRSSKRQPDLFKKFKPKPPPKIRVPGVRPTKYPTK